MTALLFTLLNFCLFGAAGYLFGYVGLLLLTGVALNVLWYSLNKL